MVYADYAATAPMRVAAKEAMLDAMEDVGNPSSIHRAGERARERVETARKEMAELLNCRPQEIFFTSGGTEANNWAISAARESLVVLSAFEHHSIMLPVSRGEEFAQVKPESDGVLDPEKVVKSLPERASFVTIMTVNNEIGTIQPIEESTREVRRHGSWAVHTDAVQAVGHIPIDVQNLGVDMLSLSAHKFGGPQGVGALYCRTGCVPLPLLFGGGQENGRRSGTENVAGIVGMCEALKIAQSRMQEETVHIRELRDWLVGEIMTIPGARINGDLERRVAGNINCSFDGVEGESLVLMLDQAGICVSAGSACASGSLEPSHVMTALGQTPPKAYEAIRISLGEENTKDDVSYIAEQLSAIVRELRGRRGRQR